MFVNASFRSILHNSHDGCNTNYKHEGNVKTSENPHVPECDSMDSISSLSSELQHSSQNQEDLCMDSYGSAKTETLRQSGHNTPQKINVLENEECKASNTTSRESAEALEYSSLVGEHTGNHYSNKY